MRCGLMISSDLETLTGGYIYDRQLADYLRQQGHRVDLVVLPGKNYLNRLLQNPLLPLSPELANMNPDILIQDELDHPALILLNHKLKSRSNYPIVSIVHHLRSSEPRPAWQNCLYRWIEKYYLLSVDGFIFNSHTTRRTVEKLTGKPQNGVIAYPCGNRLSCQVSEQEIRDRAEAPGPLRILFFGSIIRRKALHVLLAALSDLPKNSFLLTVIGDLFTDRPYVRNIFRQVRQNQLNERVAFLGPVTDSELSSRLKEHHVLAVPSCYEGFGIAYLEGMGAGLPAIGTTAGAAGEIITHGQNGFLVPPGDIKALSTYLHELSLDRGRLLDMSLKAQQHFRSHPTWEMTGEEVLDYLQSVQARQVQKIAAYPEVDGG